MFPMMKQLLLIATLALFTLTAVAQNETVQVDITKLTQQELQVYQALKQKQANAGISLDRLTPESVDKYAQMGKALGTAVNEGLGAVTKNVEQFSQTSAGKWLMVIISWKVMGQDAVGLMEKAVQFCIGGPLLVVGIIAFIWMIRRNCIQRPIKSIERKGIFAKTITFADRDPVHVDLIWAYGLCFAIFVGICSLIMFVG